MSAPILTAAERERIVLQGRDVAADMAFHGDAAERIWSVVSRLAASHAALEAEHQQFVEYHETSADEWTAKYQEAVATLTRERDETRAELNALTTLANVAEAERDRLRAEVEHWKTILELANGKQEKLEADLAAAEGRVEFAEHTRQTFENQLNDKLERLREAEGRVRELEQEAVERDAVIEARTVRLLNADATVARLRGALERIAGGAYRVDYSYDIAKEALAWTDPSGLAVIRARIAGGHSGTCDNGILGWIADDGTGMPTRGCTCGHDELVARFDPVARGEG